MRSNSLWTIAILGFVGVVVTTFVMLLSLKQLEHTTAGDRVRLANSVIQRFELNVAVATIRTDRGENGEIKYLQIEYQTNRDSKFEQEVMDSEMERIARYAVEQWTIAEVPIEEIDHVKMIRHEIRGSGCFKDKYSNTLEVENPKKKSEDRNPFDFDG